LLSLKKEEKMDMKFKIYLAITVCVFLFVTGTGQAQEKGGEANTCDALFVANAEGMAFDGHFLTMKNMDRTITYFCDRPARFAGHMTVEEVREIVSQGDKSFGDIPPNAAISVLGKGGKITTTVVHLYEKPTEKGNDMHFPVKVLLGKLPETGGASTLFIDPVGVPVSPGSVGGVKRRTRRRTAAVASSATKAAAQQQPVQTSPAATGTESVEDRLRTLDALAAGGYITKQEYAARKKAILDSM
jgi:hypothetical protein